MGGVWGGAHQARTPREREKRLRAREWAPLRKEESEDACPCVRARIRRVRGRRRRVLAVACGGKGTNLG
eukprot:7104221-Prymnesium_polylepis.1